MPAPNIGSLTQDVTKTFKTRIIQKHDTEANWQKATNFVPKKGEMIVYDIDSNHNYERIKIGDGEHIPNDLPFVTDNYYTKSETDTKLNGKQNSLSATQLNAVNSGITSDKVTKYDNYQSQITSKYTKPTTGIPKTDLASAVQTSLGKADTAVQSVTTGSANGTISVDGSNVSVKGLGTAAYKADTYFATQTAYSATAAQVNTNTHDIADLKETVTGGMHFKGKFDSLPAVTSYSAGDFVIVGTKEYILYVNASSNKSWVELGDEGSHLTKVQADEYYVAKNSNITAGTHTKITYDSKGLVTGGTELVASDIPNLPASKITSGTFADARIASASVWNAKQNALTADQLAAANSGITAEKVATYNGYATTLAGKQDKLNTAQLNAVNSGITAGKVTTYDGYQSQISAKYTKPNNGIPKTDLDSSVQTSLGKANTALQTHQTITTGSANGTIAVGGTDVHVKGLSSLAYRSSLTKTDVTSALGYTPAGVNDLTELKVELNQKFVKDPNKTYIVFKGDEFPGAATAQFKAPAGSTIDWGDGNVETFETEDTNVTSHVYDSTSSNYHLITISGGSGIPVSSFEGIAVYKAIIGSSDCGDIGDSAFEGCEDLEEVEFSTSSVNIGASAFQDCSNLREVFLHDVSSIGDYAFAGCNLLKKCVIDNETPPTIGTDSFMSTHTDFRIFVPRGAIGTYINDSGWLDYTNITVFAPDNLDLEYKQDALSTEQMNAVNSGITAAKVSTYDGYSTSKQDKLSTAQLNAVNSGITSTKVTTYDGYQSQINAKYTKPTGGIPKTDLSSAVQTSLGKADSALQSHQTITTGSANGTISVGGSDVAVKGLKALAYKDSLTKTDVGLGNVNNTSDAEKPISTATQAALNTKQDSLTTTQLNAVNSGITSGKVSTYDGYQAKIDAKYTKPNNGIPKTDLDSSVQTSLGKADTALQTHQTITTGSANGTIAVGGTDVHVKGLSSLAYKNSLTKSDVGLENVENKSSATIRSEITKSNVTTALGYTPLNSSLKGANSGIAELDENGKIPSSQLPSYVDDCVEGYLYNNKLYKESSHTTEISGESGKIYIDLASNKTYRWSGSAFVEISASLALGETSSTAYRGDRGKIAYDHSQAAHAPSNAEKNIIVGVQRNGTDLTVDSNRKVNITVPTKTSELSNDSGFTTSSDIPKASTTSPKAAGTAAVGTESAYARGDHVHPSDSTKVDKVSGKGLSTNDYTTAEKNKLSGIATGAEVNQNAFSNIIVGSTTIEADSKTDTLTLVAGSNITLTPDATNDKVTIVAKDTTYSAGDGISLSGNKFSNTGVRAISTGSSNGTISVNTNGTSANIAVKGLGSAAYTNSADYATATHTHNYAGSSSAGGAATSANKLTTARKISLGTGAIGTATSFDGSSDITIPVTGIKESYLSWGGKDIAGSFSALDAALIDDLSANRLAGLPASKITFERSSDAGSTWTTYNGNADLVTTSGSASNSNTTSSQSVNNWHRITIDVFDKIYCELRKIAILLSTNGATGCKCKIEWGDCSSTTVWTTEKTVSVSGWSGWNIINVEKTIGSSTYGKIRYVRLTFSQTSVNASFPSNLPVMKIRFYSNNCWNQPSNLAANGHVYGYDSNFNVTFPAKVTATTFDGKATKDGNGNTITSTYIKGLSASGQTITYTKGDGSTGTITTQDTKYTHPTSGVTAGTYKSVTVNNQGHVTAGTNPTTLSGYGITDAAKASDLSSHTSNTSNPHGVTKAQIGLGNVENKSSTTIRSEITKSNVTSALGYTPAGVNDLTELKVELNKKFVKDPNKTYLVFIGNEFPGNSTAQFKVPAGSTIDWGDGNVETFDTAPEGRGITTHTYVDSTSDDYHLITISDCFGIPANAFKQARIYKAIIGSSDCGDIGDSAFEGCEGLEEVEFSTSSVNIGNNAFQDCSSLREIFLHDVSSIGDYAFGGCGLLKKCVIDNEGVPIIGTSSFDSTYNDFRIFVPRVAFDSYMNDSGWSDYTNVTVFEPDSLDLESKLESKQDALTTEQMNAVNSGVTAAKVSTYDGYSTSKQDKLSTVQLNAVNSGITSSKVSTYDGYATSKQDKLSTAQLNAANSGITSSKVSTYDGYASKISTLEAKPGLDKVGTVTSIKMNGAAKTVDSNGSVDLGTVLTAHQNISGKQDKLSTAQLNAANSGITSSKVSTYDGYASKISTLEAKPGLDKVGTVTSIKMNGAAKTVDSNGSVDLGTVLTAHQNISGKQDKLSTAQLNAVNSGITSSKVSTYDGYSTSKQNKLTAGTNITLSGSTISAANPSSNIKIYKLEQSLLIRSDTMANFSNLLFTMSAGRKYHIDLYIDCSTADAGSIMCSQINIKRGTNILVDNACRTTLNAGGGVMCSLSYDNTGGSGSEKIYSYSYNYTNVNKTFRATLYIMEIL